MRVIGALIVAAALAACGREEEDPPEPPPLPPDPALDWTGTYDGTFTSTITCIFFGGGQPQSLTGPTPPTLVTAGPDRAVITYDAAGFFPVVADVTGNAATWRPTTFEFTTEDGTPITVTIESGTSTLNAPSITSTSRQTSVMRQATGEVDNCVINTTYDVTR